MRDWEPMGPRKDQPWQVIMTDPVKDMRVISYMHYLFAAMAAISAVPADMSVQLFHYEGVYRTEVPLCRDFTHAESGASILIPETGGLGITVDPERITSPALPSSSDAGNDRP